LDPHPFLVLGKSEVFGLLFSCLCSTDETVQPAPQPFNPQFRPFNAFYLTNRYRRAILSRVRQPRSSPDSCFLLPPKPCSSPSRLREPIHGVPWPLHCLCARNLPAARCAFCIPYGVAGPKSFKTCTYRQTPCFAGF